MILLAALATLSVHPVRRWQPHSVHSYPAIPDTGFSAIPLFTIFEGSG